MNKKRIVVFFIAFSSKIKQDFILVVFDHHSDMVQPLFDDILNEYLNSWELIQVKTTDMGSLFKLSYQVCFKENMNSKAFIDELRCRNGNLEIALSRSLIKDNEL